MSKFESCTKNVYAAVAAFNLSFVKRGEPPPQAVVERSGTCEYCAVSQRIRNLLIYSYFLIFLLTTKATEPIMTSIPVKRMA